MKKFFLSILFLVGVSLHAQHTFDNHGVNVGINTSNPNQVLEVRTGNVQVTSGNLFVGDYFDTSLNNYFKLRINDGGQIIRGDFPSIKFKLNESGEWPRFSDLGVAGANGHFSRHAVKGDLVLRLGGNNQNKMIFTNAGGGDIVFSTDSWNDNKIRMSIKPNGSVGIGTRNPGGWKLAVNGKIRSKEIKVETAWSDFVFENDYDLPTLKEVEKQIKEKGHLKNIPSAEEVSKNGIFLGEMNAKLLQKIEELTLYLIQQEKRIKKLERIINKNK